MRALFVRATHKVHVYLPAAAMLTSVACTASAQVATPGQGSTQYHVIKQIPLGGDGGWDYLTIDGRSRHMFISRGSHVMVVDLDTEKVVGDIPDTNGVHGIAIAPGLHRGFTSNGGDNSVTIFDLDTFKLIKKVAVGTGPDAIVYDGASKRVYTMNGRSSDATAVDGATGDVAGTIPLGGRPEFAAVDGQGKLFVNIEDKSEIVAIDSNAMKVTARWPIAPGDGPSGLAIDRRLHRLFAVCGNEKMIVVDTETGKVLATPTIGKGPDAALCNARAGVAFSSNGRDGTLSVVRDTADGTIETIASVPTLAGARTMALDFRTGRVYLVTAKFKPLATAPAPTTPTAGAPRFRRPEMEPGSFMLVVVGEK